MNLLVVEDDPAIGKALHTGFCEAGHDCTWVKDGARGLALARTRQFDAVILDLMLPLAHGMDVLKSLREEGVQTPVILLTALGAVGERVDGLQAGADDYVVKPFDFAELMARVEAVCRRAAARPSPTLAVGDVTLDLATRRVRRGETDIDLTPTEFSLLEMLMRYAGQVVTRKMLCQHLWDADWEGETNVIEVHINRLRGKVDRGNDSPLIQTVRGRGYAFRAT